MAAEVYTLDGAAAALTDGVGSLFGPRAAGAPTDANITGVVVSRVTDLDPEAVRPEYLKIELGDTVSGAPVVCVQIGNGVLPARSVFILDPMPGGSYTFPVSMLGRLSGDLQFTVHGASADREVTEALGPPQAIDFVEMEPRPELEMTQAAVIVPEYEDDRCYVSSGNPDRYRYESDFEFNRPDVTVSDRRLVRLGTPDVEIQDEDLYRTIPNSAVAGSGASLANIVVRATATPEDGGDPITVDSEILLVERTGASVPPAITLSAGNTSADIISEEEQTWRETVNVSAYGGGTIEAMQWCALPPTNPNYGDPLPEQFEPMFETSTSDVWRAGVSFSNPNTQQGLRTGDNPASTWRCRVRVNGVWSALSNSYVFDAPEFEGGGGGDPEPPEPGEFTGNWIQVRIRKPEQIEQNSVTGDFGGGHGDQGPTSISWQGNTIVICGDMWGNTVSHDGGKTWHAGRFVGLEANGGVTANVHPDNEDQIIIIGQSVTEAWASTLHDVGVYRSLNGGDSFTKVVDLVPTVVNNQNRFYFRVIQHNLNWIDWYEGDTDIGWMLVQEKLAHYSDRRNMDDMGAGLWKTTDRGATWTPVIDFGDLNTGARNQQQFGTIYRLRVDPTNQNRVFIGAESGLWVATNPTSGGSFTRIRGAWVSRADTTNNEGNGLLANRACRSFELDSDGRCVYTIDHEGVYRGFSGHTSATLWRAKDTNVQWCGDRVNRAKGWLFIGNRNGGSVAIDPEFFNGSSWQQCSIDLYPNVPGTQLPQRTHRLSGERSQPAASPTEEGVCVVHSGWIYRIENTQIQESITGFCGPSWMSIAGAQDNIDYITTGCADTQGHETLNRGRTWAHGAVIARSSSLGTQHAATGNTQFVGRAVAMFNNGSILRAIGDSGGSGQLIRHYLSGPTYNHEFADGTRRQSPGVIPVEANDQWCYFGTRRSPDRGQTWQNTPAPGGVSGWLGVYAASLVTDGVVWGLALSGLGDNSRKQFTFYRSPNRGGTWTQVAVLTDPENIVARSESSTPGNIKISPHPTNNQRAYVHTTNDVWEIGLGMSPRSLGFRAYTQGESLHKTGRPLNINSMVADWYEPDIVYVGTEDNGFPTIHRCTNATSGSPDWEVFNGHTGYSGGTLDRDITAAVGQTFEMKTGDISRYGSSGVAKIGNETVEYTVTGDLVTLTRRGIRRGPNNYGPASHDEDDTFVHWPDLAYVSNNQCQALAVLHDGTVIFGGRGSQLQAAPPPAGYTGKPGISPGIVFNSLRWSFS